MRAWVVLGIASAVGACGGHPTQFGNDGGSGNDGSPFNNDGSVTFNDGAPPPGDSGSGCSDAAKLVYVISTDNVLRSFNPATLQFATIGTLNCPGNFASPNSMAV